MTIRQSVSGFDLFEYGCFAIAFAEAHPIKNRSTTTLDTRIVNIDTSMQFQTTSNWVALKPTLAAFENLDDESRNDFFLSLSEHFCSNFDIINKLSKKQHEVQEIVRSKCRRIPDFPQPILKLKRKNFENMVYLAANVLETDVCLLDNLNNLNAFISRRQSCYLRNLSGIDKTLPGSFRHASDAEKANVAQSLSLKIMFQYRYIEWMSKVTSLLHLLDSMLNWILEKLCSKATKHLLLRDQKRSNKGRAQKKTALKLSEEIDEMDYCCCLTLEIFQDPVKASDGRTYERSAILDWFSKHDTSPWTQAIITDKSLVVDEAMIKLLQYHQIK